MAVLIEIPQIEHILVRIIVFVLIGVITIFRCGARALLEMLGERPIRFTDLLKFGSGTRIIRVFVWVRAEGFLQ